MAITVMIKAIAITAADMVNASIIMIFTSLIVRRVVYTEALIKQESLSKYFIVFIVLDQKITINIYINIINMLAGLSGCLQADFWCIAPIFQPAVR